MAATLSRFRRFCFGTLPSWWFNLCHLRPTSKWSKFYLLSAFVFIMQGIISIFLYLGMLDPVPNNPYFNLRATPNELTQLTEYGCSVTPVFPLAFWQFGFSVPLANYVFLSSLVLSAACLTLALGVFSFLVSLSYGHFQNLQRSRFERPHVSDILHGFLCKVLPLLTHTIVILLIIVILILFILIFVFDVCGNRIVAASTVFRRIKNCRRWVHRCVEDKDRYGRHLLCSLPDNFSAFPTDYCAADRQFPCVFPRNHFGSARVTRSGIIHPEDTQFTVSIHDDICAGEKISPDEGGPVPWCKMCTQARRDPHSGVYNQGIEATGMLRRYEPASPALVRRQPRRTAVEPASLFIQYKPNSFVRLKAGNDTDASGNKQADDVQQTEQTTNNPTTEKKELDTQGDTDKKPRRRQSAATALAGGEKKFALPWPTYKNPSEAFYATYVQTFATTSQASYVEQRLVLWIFTSLWIVGFYQVSIWYLTSALPPEGYLASPGSSKHELLRLPVQIFDKIMNIVTCGRWKPESA